MRAEFESYDGAGEWLFMQQCHAKVQVWKIANFQDQVTRTDKKKFTARFMYVQVYTFKVLFNLFNFVISA